MKQAFTLAFSVAVLSLPAPAAGSTIQFDYRGCAFPVTLTVTDAKPVDVWRQLAGEVGFAVRVGTHLPDTTVDFSMSGSVHEVLTALARYTGAVLVAANDDACLDARQARTVWLMSEGAASAALMSVEQNASAPTQPVVGAPPPDARQDISPRSGVQINSPRRRGQMTAADREAERERRRQARQARREGRDDR